MITGGWMNVCGKWCRWAAVAILLPCFAVSPAGVQAQDKHVVSVQDLSRDAARPAETRQANEASLRQLFSSPQAQQALKSANIDYSKVDKAVGQLTDEDTARLAERARQLQENFAAGRAGSLSDRDLLIIIIIAVLVIALIAVLR
jgi:nitrogen fixation/metabolism regulation signal transduction histidine kinase